MNQGSWPLWGAPGLRRWSKLDKTSVQPWWQVLWAFMMMPCKGPGALGGWQPKSMLPGVKEGFQSRRTTGKKRWGRGRSLFSPIIFDTLQRVPFAQIRICSSLLGDYWKGVNLWPQVFSSSQLLSHWAFPLFPPPTTPRSIICHLVINSLAVIFPFNILYIRYILIKYMGFFGNVHLWFHFL